MSVELGEFEEIEHQVSLALAQRRLARLVAEMAHEQANFESITQRSLQFIEADPESDKARDIPDDWMFMFIRYAQNVSHKEIQDMWARILSSAAVHGRRQLSPSALQTMSLIDSESALDFEKFVRVRNSFGFYPAHDQVFQNETQGINIRNLQELGLITENLVSHKYTFYDFDVSLDALPGARINMVHGTFVLSQRGTEIAGSVFPDAETHLSVALREQYLKDVLSIQIENYPISIFPKIHNRRSGMVIRINKEPRGNVSGQYIVKFSEEHSFGVLLTHLLDWASARYQLSIFGP